MRSQSIHIADGPRLGAGDRVGRYVVVAPIGHGAMGVVYRGHDPELGRDVALKLIRASDEKPGQRERRCRRQRQEARALARLSHPNVVSVFECGEYGDGVYLALELIHGRTLREWLKEKKRSTEEIVTTMIAAGQGLAAAHEAEIVHRDFKLDNVMIGSDGRVSVVDFGLAMGEGEENGEAKGDGSFEDTIESARESEGSRVVGTPAYMAPEQLVGGKVDAKSDQFSFCVCLYEALYGRRPFMREDASKRLSAIYRGELSSHRRDRNIPTWLRDAILGGLAAEPSERFPDMPTLLRSLAGPSRIRSRRWLIAAGLIASLGLGVGVGRFHLSQECDPHRRLAGVWDAQRREEVRSAISKVEGPDIQEAWSRASSMLDRYSESWSDRYRRACRALRSERSEGLNDHRASCLRAQLAKIDTAVDLLAEADADLLLRVDELREALGQLEDCSDDRRLLAGVTPPAVEIALEVEKEESRLARVRVLKSAGHYEEGLGLARLALLRARELKYPPLTAAALYETGTSHSKLGDFEGALEKLEECFRVALVAGTDPIAVDASIAILVVRGVILGRHEEALGYAEVAWAGLERLGDDPHREAQLLSVLGSIHFERGEQEKAESLQRRSLAIRETHFGPEHYSIPYSLENLANILRSQDQHQEAMVMYLRALSIVEKVMGKGHSMNGVLHRRVGDIHFERGNYAAAETEYSFAAKLYEETMGAKHLNVGLALASLARVRSRLGRYEEAEHFFVRASAIVQGALGESHLKSARIECDRAENALLDGKLGRAEQGFGKGLKVLEEVEGAKDPRLTRPLSGLAKVHIQRGNYGEAELLLRRAMALRAKEGSSQGRESVAQRADVEFALARIVASEEEATSLALAAKRRYEGAGPAFEVEYRRIEDWLASR